MEKVITIQEILIAVGGVTTILYAAFAYSCQTFNPFMFGKKIKQN